MCFILSYLKKKKSENCAITVYQLSCSSLNFLILQLFTDFDVCTCNKSNGNDVLRECMKQNIIESKMEIRKYH